MSEGSRGRKARTCLLIAEASSTRDAVSRALVEAGYRPEEVSGSEALAALERTPCVAVLASQDVGAKPLAEITARAAARRPPLPVVVLGTEGSDAALDAASEGAADYLAAPIEMRALVRRLSEVVARDAPSEPTGQSGLIGQSAAMRRLHDRIARIARYKTNVLLLGESGTGKELVARALHARGPRGQHLFVPLNCAAISREIIENELFGHERGAFTGANERKKGLFEVADGGTLFLDEIAEMELSTQGKLLRVLERNEFRRLGGTGKIKVDVSVIAATNRDLEAAVSDGKFREDLYYRLKVVTVVVPPLRERNDDIPELVRAFIADFNKRNGAELRGLGPRVLKRLIEHDWPGNVRELKNTVESAAVLTSGDTISIEAVEDVMGSPRPRSRRAPPRGGNGELLIRPGTKLAQVEREVIFDALNRCRTKTEAARSLGIGLRTLFTKLREYGVPRERGKARASASPRRGRRPARGLRARSRGKAEET